MSSGSNIGDGDGPPTGPNGIQDAPVGFGAWEKLQLGWLNYDVAQVGKKSEHRLNALGVNTKQAQAVIVPLPKELNPNVLDLGGTQAFWSGMGDNLDNTMTRDVTLPAGAVNLAFKAWYEIETCWDYAYLRVSTNGGTSYTNVQTSISDAGDENGQNFGHGITGISGTPKHCDDSSGSPAWVNATADLSAFAGQSVKLQFRYWTDGFVIGRGFVVDDIAVNGTPIGTGAANEGWTFDGFNTTTGGQTTFHEHFYIAEYRAYRDLDTSLRTAYNFGFLNTKPDWVEHFPYQDGLLVNYWDTGESDNGVGDHPGEGLILPVDAHPTLDHWSNGQLMRARIQSADSTFGLEPTDAFTVNLNSAPTTVPSKPAVPVFDDSKTYWFGSDTHGSPHPGHHQPGWFSVKVPNTGTTIRVKNLQSQGLFMHVEVGPK